MPLDLTELNHLIVLTTITAFLWGLKGTGPKLSAEVVRTVLTTVTLQDMQRLQTHRLL